MEKLVPGWTEQNENGAVKADFELAVTQLGTPFTSVALRNWIDAFDNNETFRLAPHIRNRWDDVEKIPFTQGQPQAPKEDVL